MTLFHAVAWVDHQSARILQFDAGHVEAAKVKASSHHTRQHGSTVRTEHEFYAHVCDTLAGIEQVLVVGPHTAQADFKHFLGKHRPETARHVMGYETADHPTDNQLVALARQYFVKYDRMAGAATPG